MSVNLRNHPLSQLGEIHLGRKSVQPTPNVLRDFYKNAQPHIQHPIMWFEEGERIAIANSCRREILGRRLTCYACAILPNHAHLLVRVHKITGREMIEMLKLCSRTGLMIEAGFPPAHPVWSEDVADMYKFTPQQVRTTLRYICQNPSKHRLPQQQWDFVTPYDDWPLHKKHARQ